MNLRNRTFRLEQNDAGHASSATIMRFSSADSPYTATYSGPNVAYGQAIVHGDQMVYHALDSEGNLSAGTATVTLDVSCKPPQMQLSWRWLTGDGSNGVSVWSGVDD